MTMLSVAVLHRCLCPSCLGLWDDGVSIKLEQSPHLRQHDKPAAGYVICFSTVDVFRFPVVGCN